MMRSGNSDLPKIELCLSLLKHGHLPYSYRAHKLNGQYDGLWECHIKSDLLLVYEIDDVDKVITLNDIGSHSELFR